MRDCPPFLCISVRLCVCPSQAIEKRAEQLWTSGMAAAWLQDTDEGTRRACATVNGPLLEELAKEAGHWDTECVELFRRGGELVGEFGPRAHDAEPPVVDLDDEQEQEKISMREVLVNR